MKEDAKKSAMDEGAIKERMRGTTAKKIACGFTKDFEDWRNFSNKVGHLADRTRSCDIC